MEKFTTAQIKDALVQLYKRNDADANRAYRMAFAELERRLGDEFDAWLDEVGF
jgi:hypothetical protein